MFQEEQVHRLAQIHIECTEVEHKQLKCIALAKGVTISSIVRSYINRGINVDLKSVTTTMGKTAIHLSQPEVSSTPALDLQMQRVQKSIHFSPSKIQPEYPDRRSSSELRELHKHFFARCFLEIRNPFVDRDGIHYEFSLMALASKDKLLDHMLERGKDQKLFRVYGALAEHIINNMIDQKIIASIRGDLMACPMLLLEGIVKFGIPGLFDGSNSQASSHISEHSSIEGDCNIRTQHNNLASLSKTSIVAKEDVEIFDDNSIPKGAEN